MVDHFGLMGLGAGPVNWSRLAGVALILGGVFLVVQGGQVKEPASAESAAAQR
ncbi:MAG: DMT family transporter [Delftia acidovorans]|nr:DMT family transporter [Delftia acidovorans]